MVICINQTRLSKRSKKLSMLSSEIIMRKKKKIIIIFPTVVYVLRKGNDNGKMVYLAISTIYNLLSFIH